MSGGLDYQVVHPFSSSELFVEMFDSARNGSLATFHAIRTDQIGSIPEEFTVSVKIIHFGQPVTFEVVDGSGRKIIISIPSDDDTPTSFTIYV